MKSLDVQLCSARASMRRRVTLCVIVSCAFCIFSTTTFAATVRDNFESQTWNNNDGSVAWSGDWIEVDGNSIGPTSGNVWITGGSDELRLEDRPNTGGQPSAAREANLAGATSATLSFDWRTTNGVDTSDSVVVEVSANGGGTWTTLDTFTGLSGANSDSESYDITAYASANTQVRIRVNNLYGGGGESFRLDFIEIDYVVVLSGTELSVTQADTPDPVNVANLLSYELTVSNAGPEDATGVIVSDTLPAGVTFESASASQGSCTESGGLVTCLLGDMLSGTNATINITVTSPVVTGTITNSATVSGNETDPIPGNNSSDEDTSVVNLNVNQLCYLVADAGGGNGGNDLFTSIDTVDFNPATNETNFGSGTGTNTIEAIAFNSATGVIYAANEDRLGTLSTVTGVFQPLPQTFGNGDGEFNNVDFDDVDGLAYDATTGVLYGANRRGGSDVLIQINMVTGAHVPNAFGAGIDYVEIEPYLGNTIVDDIAIDPTTGVMYASINSGGSSDRLIVVDKTDGSSPGGPLITVPDIEGLGTDSSGQLWGTSGTQGILYEINKATGVGSNGRTINNGGDYESVDCYAFSPSVIADLSVGKSVNDASPQEGDTVTYTVTVTNAGPGLATVVQLMDLLPSGVTLASATPSKGTYNAITGDWFVGNLGIGSTASLVLQADVDSGTGGTTITNTASVDFLSQADTNSSNDIASVDINPAGTPNLLVIKAATTIEDPINGTTNPKAIPGATTRYFIVTTNTGTGLVDANTFVVTDPIPANVTLRVLDYDGSNPGPIQFIDGSPVSGLSYTFVSLGDTGDDVSFSNDGGATFNYVPVPNGNGVDPAVTDIRINPKGPINASTGAGDPNMQIAFKVVVN